MMSRQRAPDGGWGRHAVRPIRCRDSRSAVGRGTQQLLATPRPLEADETGVSCSRNTRFGMLIYDGVILVYNRLRHRGQGRDRYYVPRSGGPLVMIFLTLDGAKWTISLTY
jgi:hypothetical protein